MEKKFKLPNMEYRFSIQTKGQETELMWTGEFVYRRPTIGERSNIDLMRTRLCGDLLTLDPSIAYLNEARSHLYHTIKESPDWWKDTDYGGQMFDSNVILYLYEKVMTYEKDWKKKTLGGNPTDVEENNEKTIETGRSAMEVK